VRNNIKLNDNLYSYKVNEILTR